MLTSPPAPLYALLHEACYGAGRRRPGGRRSGSGPSSREFDAAAALDGDDPVLFTGEMIYPWMFETDPALRAAGRGRGAPGPARTGRRCTTRPGCAANEVPAAAAVYFDDMYVPAAVLGADRGRTIRGLRPWVTSEYEHDGLRVSGGAVLDRLISHGPRQRVNTSQRGHYSVVFGHQVSHADLCAGTA